MPARSTALPLWIPRNARNARTEWINTKLKAPALELARPLGPETPEAPPFQCLGILWQPGRVTRLCAENEGGARQGQGQWGENTKPEPKTRTKVKRTMEYGANAQRRSWRRLFCLLVDSGFLFFWEIENWTLKTVQTRRGVVVFFFFF